MNRHNDQKIGDILKLMIADLRIQPQLHQQKVIEAWKRLMGTTINNYTRSLRLVKTTLYINIDSAPLRQELSYNKENIIKMLNEELGEQYIKEVIIK